MTCGLSWLLGSGHQVFVCPGEFFGVEAPWWVYFVGGVVVVQQLQGSREVLEDIYCDGLLGEFNQRRVALRVKLLFLNHQRILYILTIYIIQVKVSG
jgi:hypothetical protein